MSQDNFYDDNPELKRSKDITFQQILNNLVDSHDNLALKTEINNPLNLVKFRAFGIYLENENLKKSAKIIQDIIAFFLEYMVSYKRKSRTEIIKAISPNIEVDDSIVKRLTTNLK